MRLVDASGTIVAEYTYDPYGNILTATGDLAQINPLRYRGYYYDNEFGMYYLNSRYYDPKVGRFINSDDYVSTGQGVLGYNMFVYCRNSPVLLIDSNGYYPVCAPVFNDDGTEIHAPDHYESEYSNYDRDDLLYEKTTKYTDISRSEANYFYDIIKQGNYGSLIDFNPISYIFGFSSHGDYLSLIYDSVTAGKSIASSEVFDPKGRLLYLEEGYNVITHDRGFMDDDAFVTETEYLIYDQKWNLQFNNVIKQSHWNTD